jgi:signal peptide peptidase SppA
MDFLTARLKVLTRSPLWAIRPDYIAALLSFVETEPEKQAKPHTLGTKNNRVMVIPVQGVLTQNDSWFGSTYSGISDAVEKAATDPSIARAVLVVDSPGGEVTGLPETAALIASLAKTKPVSAVVEGQSASAAYWLTTQASDITIAPSAEVGSVGVRMMHVDISQALESDGIKVTEMHAGEFKTEWSPFAPLTDAAKTDMQARLDAIHKDFITAVATGRGARASADIAANRFGEGRMFDAVAALGHGLVDKVQPPREFFRAISPAVDAEEAPNYGIRRARLDIQRKRFGRG